MTIHEVRKILGYIQYKDWDFLVVEDADFGYLIINFYAPDLQKSRKWKLSPYMTKSEVVQTAFLAIRTCEEHETRERFLYKGQAIFGPHFDCDALLNLKHDSRK